MAYFDILLFFSLFSGEFVVFCFKFSLVTFCLDEHAALPPYSLAA